MGHCCDKTAALVFLLLISFLYSSFPFPHATDYSHLAIFVCVAVWGNKIYEQASPLPLCHPLHISSFLRYVSSSRTHRHVTRVFVGVSCGTTLQRASPSPFSPSHVISLLPLISRLHLIPEICLGGCLWRQNIAVHVSLFTFSQFTKPAAAKIGVLGRPC